MAVVAPLTALTSAAVPALWGVATGDTLSTLAWVGVATALLAIALSSIPNESDSAPVTVRVVVVPVEAVQPPCREVAGNPIERLQHFYGLPLVCVAVSR